MAGSALSWELADGIAVVTLDMKGEAVNKISRAAKADFLATFESLEREGAVRAVAFLSGKPDNFIAGADIEEFVALSSAAEAERLVADGQELLERVARFPKPIAVGIHGACLGGGLEFALACHYRVASDHPKTQLGLPEVQLGSSARAPRSTSSSPARWSGRRRPSGSGSSMSSSTPRFSGTSRSPRRNAWRADGAPSESVRAASPGGCSTATRSGGASCFARRASRC